VRAALAALAAALVLVAAMPAVAPARASHAPAVVTDAGTLVARGGFGRGFGGRSFGRGYRPRSYPRSYGRRGPSPFSRRGRGFLHGLFWGFLLGHWFSGGGFPIFPFVLLALFAWAASRRRRRRMRYGW
jgi:uncharacterized membrane protein